MRGVFAVLGPCLAVLCLLYGHQNIKLWLIADIQKPVRQKRLLTC